MPLGTGSLQGTFESSSVTWAMTFSGKTLRAQAIVGGGDERLNDGELQQERCEKNDLEAEAR